MDSILEARMHDRAEDGIDRKQTKGWKVVREKLVVKPVDIKTSSDNISLSSNKEVKFSTSSTFVKQTPIKQMGKARGWKVLQKRVARKQFTEDLRLSDLQLNKMDETALNRNSGSTRRKSIIPNKTTETLHE